MTRFVVSFVRLDRSERGPTGPRRRRSSLREPFSVAQRRCSRAPLRSPALETLEPDERVGLGLLALAHGCLEQAGLGRCRLAGNEERAQAMRGRERLTRASESTRSPSAGRPA